MWLGHHLAAQGYIAAAINHHGNTGIEPPTPQGFLLVWERARDMIVLLDRLLADTTFGPRIDRRRIGAAGFSLGGYTVIALAGGRFSPRQFDRFCHSPEQDFTCEPQPEFPQARAQFEELRKMDPAIEASLRHAEDSYRDARVKAVFAIAPALGGGLTRDSLGEITVPVQIVVGDKDTTAPSATNAALLASLIPKARLTTMPGVGHYTFLADCNAQGRINLPVCRDGLGVDRAETHAWANRLAVAFFESAW
jgi:predicted dienelactone hydrolase